METIKKDFELLKGLWASNKLKFILVLIPIVLLIAMKIAAWITKLSAERVMNNARRDDAALKGQADSLNNQANEHLANADKLANDSTAVDEDWNKKK